MSNPFTYKMDENTIRKQLKDYTISPTEEDWFKFNSLQTPEIHSKRKKINYVINVTLNRNVFIPVAFGLIIIVFATLLFNFIDIDGTKKTESSVTVTEPVNITSKTPSLTPVKILEKKEINSASEKPEQTITVNTEILKPEQINPVANKTDSVIQNEKKSPKNESVKANIPFDSLKSKSEMAITKSDSLEKTATLSGEETKKKKKKNVSDAFILEKSSDLRPALISEDIDSEERPEENP